MSAYTANPGALTASGSENPGTTPGLAFDGDASTRWSSQFADDAWIRVDLGAALRIDRVVLDWEAAYDARQGTPVLLQPRARDRPVRLLLYEFQVWGTGGSAAAAYPALPGEQPGTYRTTFFDDVTGTSLDRSKWRVVRTGQEMGPVNGESRAYVDNTDNISTENGSLLPKAKYCKGCTQAGAGPTTSPPGGSTPTPSWTSPTAGSAPG